MREGVLEWLEPSIVASIEETCIIIDHESEEYHKQLSGIVSKIEAALPDNEKCEISKLENIVNNAIQFAIDRSYRRGFKSCMNYFQ